MPAIFSHLPAQGILGLLAFGKALQLKLCGGACLSVRKGVSITQGRLRTPLAQTSPVQDLWQHVIDQAETCDNKIAQVHSFVAGKENIGVG